MNRQERSRLIEALESSGWDEREIDDFLLYVVSGDEQYMPKKTET